MGEMQMQKAKYTNEFKEEAVRQVIDRGHSVIDVAKRLGIGEKLKLIQSALPEKDDTKYETTNKRNVMTVAVSRYMSQTTRIIENTSLGRFPDSTTVN